MSRVVFAVDYQSEKIKQWVRRQNLAYPISFSEQTHPGILSAIQSAWKLIGKKTTIVCNTDEIRLHFQLRKAISFHEASRGIATMVVTRATHLYHHRAVEVAYNDLVLSTTLKAESYLVHPEISGFVNTGIIIFEPEAFTYCDPAYGSGWGGIIEPLIIMKQLRAYIDTDIVYFNVGTETEYREATRYLEQYP